MNRDIFGFVNGGQTRCMSGFHQVPRHLGLAVCSDDFACGQASDVDGVALARKHQINAVVNDAARAHPRAHASFM